MMLENDIFDTPERTERFELLQHLIENTQQLIYVRGPDGIGKTTFAKQLEQALFKQYEVVSLIANDCTHMLSAIMDNMPAVEVQEADYSGISFLLLIDQAEQLTSLDLQSVLALQDKGCRVVFFGTGDFNAAVTLPSIQYIDIPPFDAEQMVEFLVTRGHMGLDEKAISRLYQQTAGVPGELVAMNIDNEVAATLGNVASAGDEKKMFLPSWAMIGIAVLLLILVFQGVINSWFEQDSAQENQQASILKVPESELSKAVIESPIEAKPKPIPRPPTTVNRLPGKSKLPKSLPSLAQQPEQPLTLPIPAANSESLAIQLPELPPMEVVDTKAADASEPPAVTVMTNDEGAPEVNAAVAELQAPALLPEKAEAAMEEQPGQKQPVEKPLVEKQVEQRADIQLNAKKEKMPVVSQKSAESAPKITKPSIANQQKMSDVDWILKQNADNYTLQLVGASNKRAIQRFSEKHNVQLKTAVFRRQLNGKPWYSLIAGVFPNRAQAIVAKRKLPKSLGKTDVWPRSFASIHANIPGKKSP